MPLFDTLADGLVAGLEKTTARNVNPLYQRDPIAWASDVLGVPERTLRWSMNPGYEHHTWDGTPDPIATALEALAAAKNVGQESGTGTGKTFGAAVGTLWFMDVFDRSVVVTLAPKAEQLQLNLWKEVGKLWPKFAARNGSATLDTLRLRMVPGSDEWVMVGYGCQVRAGEESATRAQGFHAEHMLFVFEEAPGIPKPIYNSVENTCTAPHNLRLSCGNPDNENDPNHEYCTSPGVVHIRISGLDHPNVVCNDAAIVPGAVSRAAVDRRRAKYGVDSIIYQSRVRGICPAEATDSLIKKSWCFDARMLGRDDAFRETERQTFLECRGVDVANSVAGDKAAVARGVGRWLREVQAFACPNSNVLGSDVAGEMMRDHIRSERVGVDVVGVGAGTYNTIRGLGFEVQPLNGGFAPVDIEGQEESFANLRAQMWWQMSQDLRHGRIALPDDDELVADLSAPKWTTRGGKILIEAKEDLRRRLGRSPDKGDAAVYWNWVRNYTGSAATIGGALVTM